MSTAPPMILVSRTYWAGLPFWFKKRPEGAVVESLVLRAHDMRQSRALYWTSTRHPSPKVGVLMMHPRIDFGHHYLVPSLLDAGFAVLAANSRHVGNDTMAEHEEMLLDVAAGIRHLKERRGLDKVVLLGNSGGGSLLAYYQAEARLPPVERIQASPGGSPTHFDTAAMPPADLMVYIAAHKGQGKLLLDAIDPSITDERDPLSVDASLDPYAEGNGFKEPPAASRYDAAFLDRYRDAQHARVERLDRRARELLARHDEATRRSNAPDFGGLGLRERQKILRQRAAEPILVVYRTMANPAYVDPSIDPSNRDYGSLLSERPDLMNYAALGFARTVTPRAWLSTWSGLSSRADLAKNVARIAEPTLFVTAGRDREVLPGDAATVTAAIASKDKTAITIDARHYFEADAGSDSGDDVARLVDVVVPWIRERAG